MADTRPPPDHARTGDETGPGSDDGSVGTPRWVKAFVIIALVLVVLFVVLLLTGTHGPGRHALFGDAGGHTPPSGVTGHEVPQP